MDAQPRIPKVQGPLEFEDGLAWLRKTDILREIMYFSYDRNSDADLYALDAEEVREILEMNRNGEKPESLKTEPEPVMPEFVTAVGDDSISRFDAPKRKRKRSKGRKQKEGAPVAQAAAEGAEHQEERKAERQGERQGRDRRRQRPNRRKGGKEDA
jgi:hypothetical protein